MQNNPPLQPLWEQYCEFQPQFMDRKLKYSKSVTELEMKLKSHNLVFSSFKTLSSSQYTCIPIKKQTKKVLNSLENH